MNYFDTHFHLDLFKNDVALSKKIEENKIYTIAVTNAPSVFEHSHNICLDKTYIKAALGYHPEVIPIVGNQISSFEKLLSKTKYIGEIGLDYSNSTQIGKEEQRRVFGRILELCDASGDKLLTVHSRKAEQDVIEMIGNNYNGRIILHYYSGDKALLKKAIDYGYYFSINYAMIKTANGKSIISEIPLERILTESDGPFLSFNKIKASPLDIFKTNSQLATLLNLTEEETGMIIFKNFKDLLIKTSSC